MLLTSSDTKRTLLDLFLFTTSVQRELVSICTQTANNFPCSTTLVSGIFRNYGFAGAYSGICPGGGLIFFSFQGGAYHPLAETPLKSIILLVQGKLSSHSRPSEYTSDGFQLSCGTGRGLRYLLLTLKPTLKR